MQIAHIVDDVSIPGEYANSAGLVSLTAAVFLQSRLAEYVSVTFRIYFRYVSGVSLKLNFADFLKLPRRPLLPVIPTPLGGDSRQEQIKVSRPDGFNKVRFCALLENVLARTGWQVMEAFFITSVGN